MDEIRCGEPDCPDMASYRGVVEIGNLTGGMMGGVFTRSRAYECPSGHTTTFGTALARLNALFRRTRSDHEAHPENHRGPKLPKDHEQDGRDSKP